MVEGGEGTKYVLNMKIEESQRLKWEGKDTAHDSF